MSNPITPLPPAPAITDTASEFNAKAFPFVDALAGLVTEINAWTEELDASIVSDVFSGTGAQTAFTLSVVPVNAKAVRVDVFGVIQRPIIDYTVAGNVLTFAVAPANATNNIYCLTMTPVNVGVPDDGSVTTAKFAVDAVAPDSQKVGGRTITSSTADPTGGDDGDIHLKYTA